MKSGINNQFKRFDYPVDAEIGNVMPVTQGLVVCRQWSIERIKEIYDNELKILSGGASMIERDTWPVQLQAAQAFIEKKSNDEQKAMLDALLVDGETKTDLSNRIIKKNKKMQMLIGLAGGLKRKITQRIDSATTVDEIEQIMTKAAGEINEAIKAFKEG